MRIRRWVLAAGLLASGAAHAAAPPATVSIETRWWNEHDFGWRLAEAAGVRWAITDGISSRCRIGGENVPAAKLADEFEKLSGIKSELIGGVLVLHRPAEARRKELEAQLTPGGAEAIRAAWLLGFLKDANAWPALARAAADKEPAVALSAAHALRRLDGEEDFDPRRWGGDAGRSQVSLGAVFKDPVDPAGLEALAKSSYVALREAAARIAAGSGSGKTLVDKLLQDSSIYVRQAAARAQRAWQAPEIPKSPKAVEKQDLPKLWAAFTSKGDDGPRTAGYTIATYGAEEDLQKLAEIYQTTQSVHVCAGTLSNLACCAGGPAATEVFRKLAASGAPWPEINHGEGIANARNIALGKYGLARLMDGEHLAKELGPRLGTENWAFSSEFVLARFCGPAVLPDLQRVLSKRGHVAPLAVGYIGGPEGVQMIEPLLASEDLSIATAAARGLGESGQFAAIAPLIKALANPNRVLRSRAALALGRIGGPDATKALAGLLKTEQEYLPKRSAWAMLKEIDSGEKTLADAVSAAEKELTEFVPGFHPVNSHLGLDFPAGKVVAVSGVLTVANVGETRCAVDQYSGLWIRYGGCNGPYNNECIGFDVASGKMFVIRPPENMGYFYNEIRAAQGCSRGMAFDPKSRCFFINHAVGGTGQPVNGIYPGRSVCRYDAALDRFVGNFPGYRQDLGGGEGPCAFVADSTRGLIISEWMGPVTWAIDTSNNKLVDVAFARAPALPEKYLHDPMAYDPVSDQVIRYAGPGYDSNKRKPENVGLWLFDLAGGKATKSKGGLPAGSYAGGNSMVFDSLNRQVVLFLSSGAWLYDRAQAGWTKAADGECNKVFYAVDYDPQHNVFLGCGSEGGRTLSAFRLKSVPAGTKAFYGGGKP